MQNYSNSTFLILISSAIWARNCREASENVNTEVLGYIRGEQLKNQAFFTVYCPPQRHYEGFNHFLSIVNNRETLTSR